jgi:hypothetical protein
MGIRRGSTVHDDDSFAARARLREARRPLLGRRKKSGKTLTSIGWFLVLCIFAVLFGGVLAFAT